MNEVIYLQYERDLNNLLNLDENLVNKFGMSFLIGLY